MNDQKLRDYSQFPALNPSVSEIRIIKLQPGDADAPIQCTYHVKSLNDAEPSYETLSYAWSEVGGKKTVYIDSRPAEVSSTLFTVMKRLRKTQAIRYLWIDAISINQADDVEKTQQVDMMRRIYSQCSRSAIWLGPLGTTSSEAAQAALDTIAWIAKEKPQPSWFQDPTQRAQGVSALKSLITLPWWGRIWTVQEAILPPDATLYWGDFELPWELMHRASQELMAGKTSVPHELYMNGAANDITASMIGLKASVNERPLYLFWRWRFRGSTDPRDKVYGLMGMRDDFALPSVRSCDYTVDVVTLFSRVTVDLIGLNRDLEPLIGRRGEPSFHKGMPSWAVDWWGQGDGSGTAEFWEHTKRYLRHEYTTDAGLYGVGDGPRLVDERTLTLHGVFVDKVAVVERRDASRQIEHHRTDAALILASSDRWGEFIANYRAWLAVNKPGSDKDGSWIRAFLGVITGRLIPEDPDHGDDLQDWLYNMVNRQLLFVTEHGRFGLGPLTLRPGHEVWAVGGCRFPVILEARPDLSGNKTADTRGKQNLDFTFVGDCFVYGIMRGARAHTPHGPVDIRLH